MLFVTGSPPIYDDSTLTTKLLGGFKLRVGAARTLVGVGPGRTSCGPIPAQVEDVEIVGSQARETLLKIRHKSSTQSQP